MKKYFVLANCLALFFSISMPGLGQTAAEDIAKGDIAYAEFDNQKALDEYLAAVELEQSNYEALWKTARAYVDLADVIENSEKDAKERRMKMYSKSVSYARRAIAVNPNDTWGHFSLSAAMGKKVLLQGKKEQIDASKVIKAEIEKAIELDPTNDLADHAMGRWHRRMAEIGGAKRFFGGLLYGSIPKGSFAESERFLIKAIELKPNYINHHLELGRTYAAMEKNNLAAEEFQKAIDLPISASRDKMLKEEAAAELKNVQKKKS